MNTDTAQSSSGYATLYTLSGTMSGDTVLLSMKKTEYGIIQINGKYQPDLSNIRFENIVEFHSRKFERSPRNTSNAWKTYTPKSPINDGFYANVAVTIRNLASDPSYGNSHLAVLALTTLTDDAPYHEKINGTCTFSQ